MGASSFERRLGLRHHVSWVEIGWYYRVPGEHRPDGSPRAERCRGFLVDVSVSGAALVAARTPHLEVGSVAGLEFRDLAGMVTVRRIDSFGHDDTAVRYGIEFTDANSPIAIGLSDAFLARYSQLPAWRDPRLRAVDGTDTPVGEAAEPEAPAASMVPAMPAPIDASSLGRLKV